MGTDNLITLSLNRRTTMTHVKDVFGRDLQLFDKFLVGFDGQMKRFQKAHDDIAKNIPNYPPYNIKKTGENTYVIELAVAGFSKSEIEIELDGDRLFIKGNTSEQSVDEQNTYLHHGIATRPFTRMFMLNDNVEVKNAAMVNGMLKVILEQIVPEQNKPKRIDIADEPSTVSEFTSGNLYKTGEQIFGPGSK
jgi:molecular chaperone IbpA